MIINTFRAMFLGVAVKADLPADNDIRESAVAFAVMGWDNMRQPYRWACVLAVSMLRVYSLLLLGAPIDKLSGVQSASLLDKWSRLPTSAPSDFVRAISVFFLMGTMDHPKTFSNLSLEGRSAYDKNLKVYHDLV